MKKETPDKKLEKEISDLKARIGVLEKDMENVRQNLNFIDATGITQIQINDVVHEKLELLRKTVEKVLTVQKAIPEGLIS